MVLDKNHIYRELRRRPAFHTRPNDGSHSDEVSTVRSNFAPTRQAGSFCFLCFSTVNTSNQERENKDRNGPVFLSACILFFLYIIKLCHLCQAQIVNDARTLFLIMN